MPPKYLLGAERTEFVRDFVDHWTRTVYDRYTEDGRQLLVKITVTSREGHSSIAISWPAEGQWLYTGGSDDKEAIANVTRHLRAVAAKNARKALR